MNKDIVGTLSIYAWLPYNSPDGFSDAKLFLLERHKGMERADAIALVNAFKEHNETLSYKFTPDSEML